MVYRVCIHVQPAILELDKPTKWQWHQVHAEYPTLGGAIGPVAELTLTSILHGNVAPNISLVFESETGSVEKDDSPTGCYASVHNNESDLTIMPVEYPIYDYSKVNPVQVLHEGKLDIISTYTVEEKLAIVYADLLQSSLKSFDIKLWLLVILTFFVFSGLLLLRQVCIKMNKDTEDKLTLRRAINLMKETSYAPIFETFTHMIGQDCTEFADRPGNVISLTMTVGFFLILVFYLNSMSTDLVVVTKPHVINNYRDVMNVENGSIGFFVALHNANEFEKAQPGTIQEEFWERFKHSQFMFDTSGDSEANAEFLVKLMKKTSFWIISSLYSEVFLEFCCRALDGVKIGNKMLGETYGWITSDPEGKQQTQGFILRQGLKNDLIIKGQRKLKRIFEGSLFSKTYSDSFGGFDMGPMLAGTSYSNIRECMSKEVHYNQPEVETVNVRNFKYLALICMLLIIVSFVVLYGELIDKLTKRARVQKQTRVTILSQRGVTA